MVEVFLIFFIFYLIYLIVKDLQWIESDFRQFHLLKSILDVSSDAELVRQDSFQINHMQSDPTTKQNIEIFLLCLKIVHDKTQKLPNFIRNTPLNEQVNCVEVKRSNRKTCLGFFEPENRLAKQ